MKKLTIVLIVITLLGIIQAETITIGANVNQVSVIDASVGNTVLSYDCGSFEVEDIEIAGEDWQSIHLENEGLHTVAGNPALPVVKRSLIIPDARGMKVEILSSEYSEIDLKAVPSRGILSREIDPATAAYEFGEIYNQDKWYPESAVELGSPYIFRDYRGVNLKINAFQYNAVQQKLRVYTHLEVAVVESGQSRENEKTNRAKKESREFHELYSRHFLNYVPDRYTTIEETAGRMLIISYGSFMEEMQPFIDWKIQKGIDTEIVDVSAIGNNSTSISNYIQSEYEQNDGLVWVLLVGDGAEVATKTYSGAGGDPQYSYVDGTDSYSDIFIGRFSAETEADVITQVERSIYYERDIDITSGDWMQKGTGIASSQGSGSGHYGEADYVHIGYIRDDLLDYDYTLIDEIYDTTGANASMVSNAVNEGRGIINYCGHGSNTSWVTTGFNNTYVNALTNDYKLPFIQSIACVNGNFTGRTCFAEAWLRATNDGAPTGAVVMFAASINQSWAPPMYAQDESVDLMCAEELNTVGGLWFNGVSYMLDESGSTSMAKTWHIFGDPSLQVRSKVPEAINASIEETILLGQETYTVPAGFGGALASLSYEGEILAEAYSGTDGNAYLALANLPEEPATLTLTITGYNKITQIEEVEFMVTGGAYLQMLSYNLVSGNDSELYAGEYADLGITLMNIGSEEAEEVLFTLSCENEHITISDATELVPVIAINQMMSLDNCFSFTISEDALNGEPVNLYIEAADAEQNWQFGIGEIIYAPQGIQSDPEILACSLGLDETGTMDVSLHNNNYSGDISYMIMIDETTGNRSIEGSTLTCDANSFVAGETVDWTFTCQNNSPDWEWIKDIQIAFPAGVIVNSSSDFSGGSGDLEFQGAAGNGATCIWHGESSSGWGNLHNGESATATVNLTIMPGFTGDVLMDWQLTGDDYGDDPHIITGDIQVTTNTLPVTWLEVDVSTGELLAGETATHTFNFDSASLSTGLYTADIIISNSNEDLIIPVEFYVNMGMINYGDIDDNGLVESYDSSILLQYIVGLDPVAAPLPWEIWREARADVDGNGSVESYDSALILQYVVEIITEFPAETGRDHTAPLGECDIRVNSEEQTYLEFYTRGEVYALDIMCRNHEFILGEPEVSENLMAAYNDNNNIYRYALISSEPMGRAQYCLRIPVTGYVESGELDIYLKINGREFTDQIYLYPGVIPASSRLIGNYPNPFNPVTQIKYSLSENSYVNLAVYNIKGQKIKNLVSEEQGSGYHQITWNGKNDKGTVCSSGAYFYLLKTENDVQTKKMILLK